MTHVLKISGGRLQNVLTLKFWSLEMRHSDNNKLLVTKHTQPNTKSMHGIPQISCKLLVSHTWYFIKCT